MEQKRAIKQLIKLKKLSGKMKLAGENWRSEFQTLIATVLSARSLDETTIKYASILFKKYPNAKKLSKARITDVQKIIRPINFYRNKSKSVINCSKKLISDFNSRVSHDINELIGLPGVGRKTANVFLSEYGHSAIAVDTHLSYISHYLGWTKSKKPAIIEKDLGKLFPKNYWSKLNPTIVKFGKKYTSRKEKNNILNNIKHI